MFAFFLAPFLVLGCPVLAPAPSTPSTRSCGGAGVRGHFTLALAAMWSFGASAVPVGNTFCIFFSAPWFTMLAFLLFVFFALTVFFLLVLRRWLLDHSVCTGFLGFMFSFIFIPMSFLAFVLTPVAFLRSSFLRYLLVGPSGLRLLGFSYRRLNCFVNCQDWRV